MPSSREQSPQRKKASLESGFLVHFTGKMPYELMATKLTSLDCLTVHKNFRNSLQKDFHIILFILKPPIRSKWVPFYRCRNWESRRLRNLFRVSKEEASRARAQTFIFKFPISHSFSQSFPLRDPTTQRSLSISQNHLFYFLGVSTLFFKFPFISHALPNEDYWFPTWKYFKFLLNCF